jgi:hypothetical protein
MTKVKNSYYLRKVKKTIVKDQRRRVVLVTMAAIWSGRRFDDNHLFPSSFLAGLFLSQLLHFPLQILST